MKLILQPKGSSLCGQCCVAMLLDISLEEAIKLVGHDGVSSTEDLLKCFDPLPYSRAIKDCIFYGNLYKLDRSISSRYIYLCKHRNPKNLKQKHWTVFNQGAIMDPSGRPEKDLWPTYRYWIV